MITVDLRAFLDEHYERVLAYLDEHAELIKEDEQETILYPNGLRLEKKDTTTIKKAHLSIHVDNAETAKQLLHSLGQQPELVWKKQRRVYSWKGMQAVLYVTPGFGSVLEFSQHCQEEEQQDVYSTMKQALHDLHLYPASAEEFEKRFQQFKQ